MFTERQGMEIKEILRRFFNANCDNYLDINLSERCKFHFDNCYEHEEYRFLLKLEELLCRFNGVEH